jgi:hypothetical protein
LQPVEGVVPGVGPFDVPTLTSLDGRLVAPVSDLVAHASFGQFSLRFSES